MPADSPANPNDSTETVTLRVNGEDQEVPPEDLTVEALLRHLGRDPDTPGVAVAVENTVVRRADWPKRALSGGDRVEIITASQGG